jgi:hypothetical protein
MDDELYHHDGIGTIDPIVLPRRSLQTMSNIPIHGQLNHIHTEACQQKISILQQQQTSEIANTYRRAQIRTETPQR